MEAQEVATVDTKAIDLQEDPGPAANQYMWMFKMIKPEQKEKLRLLLQRKVPNGI